VRVAWAKPFGLSVNMGNGSIRVPEGKVFYMEWSNFEVERSF